MSVCKSSKAPLKLYNVDIFSFLVNKWSLKRQDLFFPLFNMPLCFWFTDLFLILKYNAKKSCFFHKVSLSVFLINAFIIQETILIFSCALIVFWWYFLSINLVKDFFNANFFFIQVFFCFVFNVSFFWFCEYQVWFCILQIWAK